MNITEADRASAMILVRYWVPGFSRETQQTMRDAIAKAIAWAREQELSDCVDEIRIAEGEGAAKRLAAARREVLG